MVPENWKTHPIGRLCTSIVPGRNKPKEFDGNIPWITTPEIDGRYLPSRRQRNYINEDIAAEAGAKIVPAGAVVITAVGELGLVAITTEPTILNQQLHAFLCPQHIHNEYLAYWLETQRPYMDTVASKTTIPYMNKANCESIPISYPALSEQTKIAQILSTWDKAIATTERLLANSQQQKQALMQQLLTGKKRLPIFIKPWTESSLERLFTFGRGKALSKSDISIEGTTKCILYGELYTKYKEVARRAFSRTNSNEGEPSKSGDILIPSSTTTSAIDLANATALLEDGILLGGDIIILRPKTEDIDSTFFAYLLTHIKKNEIAALAQGITIIHLYGSELKKLKVLTPPLPEQQKIAQVLSTADAEISNLQAQLAKLKLEKKALMQQLLTGQRRVKPDADAAA